MLATRPAHQRPKQTRSQRTQERLLRATERLLVSHRFETITVEQIVKAARSSVGSFYARFRDKDALLPLLYERYDHSLGKEREKCSHDGPWKSGDLREIAGAIADLFVQTYRARPFLLRALALYVRSQPQDIDDATRRRRESQHQFLVDALLACGEQIHHPAPRRAVEFALYFAATACRDRILFADSTHAGALQGDDAELQREIRHMIVGYLTGR